LLKDPSLFDMGSFYLGKFSGGIEMRSVGQLVLAIIMVIGIVLSAAACSTDNSTTHSGNITVTDQLGRTVTLNSTPQRIISLAPANTEILFALGLNQSVVGDTTYCDYPAEAVNKTKIGGFSDPNIETILNMSPDVVFAAPIDKEQVIPQLENLGIKVVVLNPTTINETYAAIELVGNVTGTQAVAESLVKSMKARVNAVTRLVANLTDDENPNVFYVVWHDPLMTAGGDTLPGQLIELAGGKNIFANVSGYPTVSLESVLTAEPQVIIAGTGMGSGADAPFQWAQNNSFLQGTEARKEGKVFNINTDLAGRYGPRIVDALEEMFRLIHPDLAAKLNISGGF
jgi:iron complex transport system substrate-binding protein